MLEEHPALVFIALGFIPQLVRRQGVFADSSLVCGLDFDGFPFVGWVPLAHDCSETWNTHTPNQIYFN